MPTTKELTLFEQWTIARKWILPALEQTNGTHTEDDILAGILSGQFTLWLGKKSAFVTEFNEFPRMKCLHFFMVGGEMAEVLRMEKQVAKWAKANGCSRVTLAGRKGWERVLKDYAFNCTSLYRDI